MGPCAFAIYVLLVDSIVEYTHFLDQNLQDLQNFLNWGCHLVGWFFIGGLPPFLSPHPLPLLHGLLIRDFKGHGEGEIGRHCLPTWVLYSRRRCRLWVASGGSPRLGGSHRFFRFGGDRLRSTAKRRLAALLRRGFCLRLCRMRRRRLAVTPMLHFSLRLTSLRIVL